MDFDVCWVSDVFAFSRCDDRGSPPHMHTRKRYAAALAAIVYRTARLYMFVVFMLVLFTFVLCGLSRLLPGTTSLISCVFG